MTQNTTRTYDDFFAKYVQYETAPVNMAAPFTAKSHIFGSVTPTKDPLLDLDERYYDNSIHRHSPYFKRLRQLRETAKLYSDMGLFPERYSEEHPIYPQKFELYDRARLTLNSACKVIKFGTGNRICIFSDGYVILETQSTVPPAICVGIDKHMQVTDESYAEFLRSKNIDRDTEYYFAKLIDYSDTIDENGGELSLSVELSMDCAVTSCLKIQLKLQKITDCNDKNESDEELEKSEEP